MAAKGTSEEDMFRHALQFGGLDEQRDYVRRTCGEDVVLCAAVEALLRQHHASSILDVPALESLFPYETAPLTEGPGTTIDRYKLLEKIGEGGMAVVYMAEQERPIRRKVALKIIKLGMDTRQVIARFEAERQALALMDHPCIAKVLDAGATETGRPYFVMELVEGVSITEYCDRNRLSAKDRLGLFLQVCNAVQHAHQKGIIHRDIKPSNVMVTHHDGKPVPKVIDFGIAKAINQRLTEKTLFTRYAHLIGTPTYMSPEQAELSDLDIDTRSDIYSLGVLLYELLTGTTPLSEEELRKAGYIEMQRVIREQEPLKPSTKLTTLGDLSTEIAKRRNSSPDLLRKIIRGDLDWIVMKALEKDRTRRYETANALGVDVQRHLASEPVLARAPSTVYRTCKFLRRHHSQILAVSAMLVVTVALATLLFQWNRNRRKLDETKGLRHAAILSQARELYAKADRKAALETIGPILDGSRVGPEARLLQTGILVEDRRFEEATAIATSLLKQRPEIAGTAYALLARILWESESLDAEKLKQFDEYRQKAEELLPETAEAYYLRAMTAPTIKEQFAALDKALTLNPHHYEARRLRAFTYYASRKYDRLRDDALAMTILRDQDPLGYSLRAEAGQELGRYADAIVDYSRAMALTPEDSPQYLDLAIHRCEALLRMGNYEDAAEEARDCSERWPDAPVFHYYKFCTQTVQGNYDKAADLFRQIVSRTPTARDAFWSWATEYVFETLTAGQSWHPSDYEPTGAAFLPLVQAEETYRNLSAKGRRIVRDGFSAQWSPDGRKLAFSLGVLSRSGVAVYDADTRQTDLLIVPGKYPQWSPDGQSIAFVRDRQFLRMPEFMAADPRNQPPAPTDEEVWIMESDGTHPRRLARGVWPSWGRDSDCIYYRSRPDSTLYSIAVVDERAEPTQITPRAGFNPSVSPDNRYVAYLEGTSLKVIDLDSQSVVAERPLPVPSDGWSRPAWSPTSNELCLGGSGGLGNRTGLWIYRLDRSEPAQTLSGPITIGSWSPDGRKLVFELGAPHYEIWTADLASATSAIETLGPARTVEEHLRELVLRQTGRIQLDPLDAYAYFNRARCYDCLQDQASANADMRRWSAVASGRLPWDYSRIIDLPFDCELVFSAERPVNTMPTMSVAFGQKARSERKLFGIPMSMVSLVGQCFLARPEIPAAHADFTFGEPVNIRSAFPLLNLVSDWFDCFSTNGLEVYLESDRTGGRGGYDLYVCKRASPEDDWGPLQNLGPTVNSGSVEAMSSLSPDGLELYFNSNRSGGWGGWDLWVTRRATPDSNDWSPPANLGAPVNSPNLEGCPWVASDGRELYFISDRRGGYGGWGDLYVSKRATTNDPWGAPVNLGPAVNSPANETCPRVSPDGQLLIFQDGAGAFRPGGYGGGDIWMTRRASRDAPWQPAVNLGPIINGPNWDCRPCLAHDGSALYFMRLSGGISAWWKAPILPVVEFSGVLDPPWDCELVFSAERPVNTISTMSVAFGQKGRCEMKPFKVPMVVASLVGLCFLAGPEIPAAHADFTFGEPVEIQSAFPLLSLTGDYLNCFSEDGLEMYLDSNRSGGYSQWDIWVCKRASSEDDWGIPENLGPTINSGSYNWASSLSSDGLELYFCSFRPGGHGNHDLYVTARATRDGLWGPPTNLGPNVNNSGQDVSPWVSADGLELYFQSNRAGGYGASDIYVSTRATVQDPWGPASNLGPAVNSPFDESDPRLSPDGLLLVFDDGNAHRPGGYGGTDLWMTRRASRSAPWGPPVNLGPFVNSSIGDSCRGGCFAPDGSGLYFGRVEGAGITSAAWLKVPMIPIVDFNADGAVDLADLVLLIDNWGTDDPLYDIGPSAWGDGKVDVEDLKAFIAEWEKQDPPAQL